MSFFRRASAKKGKGAQPKAVVVPKIKTPSPSTLSQGSTDVLAGVNGNAGVSPGFHANSPTSSGLLLMQDDYFPGDLGVSHSQEAFEKRTRLSPGFQDIIKDHDAIPYLIQYLEACKGAWLIRFWLDAESFQASTWTRIRTHSLHSLSKSSVIQDRRGMKRSQSLNQDITSPASINSHVTSPESINSHTSEGDNTTQSCSDISMSGASSLNQVDDSLNITDELSSPESREDGAKKGTSGDTSITSNQSGDLVTSCDKTEGVPTATDSTSCLEDAGSSVPTNINNDSRDRERCKSEDVRSSLTLPLNQSNTEKPAKATHKRSESAISYRDITTPSPTGKENSGLNTKTATSRSVSKESLAEKLKKSVEQDAVTIFTKYLAREATHPIGITDNLRNDTIRKICREDGQVDPECFVESQAFALQRIEQEYFGGFKTSTFSYKYQVDLLTNGKIRITDIIYHETAFFYFMEYMEREHLSNLQQFVIAADTLYKDYMEREHLSNLLQFVIAADNFENTLASQESYDAMQAQGDAMVLYDKYFSLQAGQPLGFPDSVRFEIEGNICREEGPLPDCFTKPRQIVLHTIEKLHFQRYLTSDVFYKYLSELVSMVQTSQDFPLVHRRKRRGSETSSEHSVGSHSLGSESISSKNTLLAAGSTHRPAATARVQLNKLEENMQDLDLDPALLNPDSLWERPMTGKMSIGKIDTLGQFVSDFAPDPEAVGTSSSKKKANSGSRFFRSKKEKEKEEEEMARKVADMILKDVTSVTQAISAIKNDGQTQLDS